MYILQSLSVGRVEFYEKHVLSHDIISTINIVNNNNKLSYKKISVATMIVGDYL